MAWTAPMTAVANEVWTSAQFNTHVRDNFLETAPAVLSSTGLHAVSDGVNSLIGRSSDSATVVTAESTSSTSYTDLATVGPSVTLTTGAAVLVHMSSASTNNTGSATNYTAFRVSGATTVSLESGIHVMYTNSLDSGQTFTTAVWVYYDQLNAGSNTFTLQHKTSAGTATWSERHIAVIAM